MIKIIKPDKNKIIRLGSILKTSIGVFLLSGFILPIQSAYSQGVPFQTAPEVSGETCTVELEQEGTFGANAASTILDSQNFGGTGAQIRVTSRKRLPGDSPAARFRVSLLPPTTFTSAPAGGDTDVTFRTRFSGTSINNGVTFGQGGGRLGTRSRGLPRTGTSITQITGHLRAVKDVGAFPGGEYRAVATLLCE